ncbi:MAG: RDD family protein [Micrococcales bacterium]|nr:MAG: RDD family protein [Micrococcales bacterium]PIE25991.1 MAG: RDD family protein [Micrococcales bacterium]
MAPASAPMRILSGILDYGLMLIALYFVLWFFSAPASLDEAARTAFDLVLAVGVVVGFPTLVETTTRGRSLGKLAAGLRTVRDDGGPIRVRHAGIRAMVALFEVLMTSGAVALITAMSNSRGKRLGDMVAGTYVVRERAHRHQPLQLAMPPRLGAWAANVDIARIPPDLALSIRQFLMRTQHLTPAARLRLSTDLAQQLARFVAPPPPAATVPEEFLVAVLVVRRDRELARLQTEQRTATARAHLVHRLPHGLGQQPVTGAGPSGPPWPPASAWAPGGPQ